MSAPSASNQPDLALLGRLARIERICAITAAAISAAVLLLWLVRPLLPALDAPGWQQMKFNTALGCGLIALGLLLRVPGAAPARVRATLLLSAVVLALALGALFQYATGLSLFIDQLVVRDPSPSLPGRMSPQTATVLALAAAAMLLLRRTSGFGARLADLLVVALVGVVLMLLCGYLFRASGLYGISGETVTSPQSLICFLLLAFTIAARRALYGFTSVLVGVGIGSHIARIVLPAALVLPSVLALLRLYASESGIADRATSTAVTVASQTLIVMCLVIWMAWRINALESRLRHASLTDELTGAHNRRGFMLIAEQALALARRNGQSARLFFFDLDGLKRINDSLGHDAGSEFIRTMAELLRRGFRESDVIGRIGGDELVALAIDDTGDPDQRVAALHDAAAQLQAERRSDYPLAFSAGHAPVDLTASRPLEAALRIADERMYANKLERRAQRA